MFFIQSDNLCLLTEAFAVNIIVNYTHTINMYTNIYIYWRRKWQTTPVVLPGESHGQMSLAGYSPWGHKESDMTELLTHTHTHTHIHFKI